MLFQISLPGQRYPQGETIDIMFPLGVSYRGNYLLEGAGRHQL